MTNPLAARRVEPAFHDMQEMCDNYNSRKYMIDLGHYWYVGRDRNGDDQMLKWESQFASPRWIDENLPRAAAYVKKVVGGDDELVRNILFRVQGRA